MGRKLRVDASVYFGLCLGLLVLPISWFLAAMLSAVFHELCHYIMAKALGISCRQFHVGIHGMTMIFPALSRKEELLIAVAGPLGSFLLLAFLRWYPQLAVSGLVQGFFNLIPIYPMDGGRILRCILRNSDS